MNGAAGKGRSSRKVYEPMMTSLDLPSSYGRQRRVRFLYKNRIDMHERVLGRKPTNKVDQSGTESAGLPA